MSEEADHLIAKRRHQARNRNAIRKQISNWLLAISLALSGGGLLDLFSESARFSRIEGIAFFALGLVIFLVSLVVLYYVEDEDMSQ
ncbi:MAG: hypothetical protein WBF53_13205 [Litorimonas sp.]